MALTLSQVFIALVLAASVATNEALSLEILSSSQEAKALQTSSSSNEATELGMMSSSSLQEMEKVFSRSDEAHAESMAAMMRSMSAASAIRLLRKNNMTTPALVQLAEAAMGVRKSNLRTGTTQKPVGIQGAKTLLNQMIYEAMAKYDAEISKCTSFYTDQCGQLDTCRGKIAGANFVAANSRSLILDSQAGINKMEEDIPQTKMELKQHQTKCEREISKMESRKAVLEGDLAVLTKILEMTDCDKKSAASLVQLRDWGVLHCKDACTKSQFISFNHSVLNEQVAKLTPESRKLMHDEFQDLLKDDHSTRSVDLVQIAVQQSPAVNKTQFNNPPLPRTKVPGNPCSDLTPFPGTGKKRSAKCALTPGSCIKLQERFLLIQGNVQDAKDEIVQQLELFGRFCEETDTTLTSEIDKDQKSLDNYQVKLGFATEKEATAAEEARGTAKEHEMLTEELESTMKKCNDNYLSLEGEMCALKKIRGEVMKMKSDGHDGFFQDCTVSPWEAHECSVKCAEPGMPGGERHLTRDIMTNADGGAECLPLTAVQSCNRDPCKVDCVLQEWSGWSKCSANCGGGVRQRVREVEVAAKYGGKPCGQSSETRPCNTDACEMDCELTDWSAWSSCSKDCDGGTAKRMKFVKQKAKGEGTCPTGWDPKRLQYKECNMNRCEVALGAKTLTCKNKLDVVLLIDGSGSLGEEGWKAELKAAELFVDAFAESGSEAQVSVFLYSGPSTWGGVRRCFSKGHEDGKWRMENVCKIKTVTHFSSSMSDVKKKVHELEWPQGSTLSSLALYEAAAELQLGRKDAKSVVVVFTDGKPLSVRATYIASRQLREKTRLVWVPVTKFAPLKDIKTWATRRWEENVVQVPDFSTLEDHGNEIIDHIIANICPHE